jgi:uncharacterized protein (TIGR02246 family)
MSHPIATQTDVRSAIIAANERFMATYRRGDARGMAELYTDDGQVLPPHADFVSGKPALEAMWQSFMDAGVKEIQLHTGEVEQHGDTAFEVSRGTMLADGGQVIDEAKYIVIWKREPDGWKLHRDIFNSSRPAT